MIPVDLYKTLLQFQSSLDLGVIDLNPSFNSREVWVHYDEPAENVKRYTYVILEGRKVIALAALTPADPLNGKAVMALGYAVHEDHRGKGLAKKIAGAAVKEFDFGIRKHKIPLMYIEASVEVRNVASNVVSKSIFGEIVQTGIDHRNNEAINLYRKFVGIRPFEI